jgi:hypothetical protein
MSETRVMFLQLDDLNDEARDRFLEFMDAEESDYDKCPVAMVMREVETNVTRAT